MKTSHLADKLYQLRAQKRIQQKELAAAIGVDAPMYSRIEKGTRIPKADQLEKLASILDVKLEELQTLMVADRVAEAVDNEPSKIQSNAMAIVNESLNNPK